MYDENLEQPNGSRVDRIKRWLNENKANLFVGTFFTGCAAAVVYVSYKEAQEEQAQIKAHNQWANDMNNWLNDEHNAGNRVYPLADGRFLRVPNDAPQETVIK